ncbi:MAG: hypothetical protein OHK0015_12030 [Chloroflexi bacterium OHK40]
MSEAINQHDGAALEQLIYQVRGVHAARLVTNNGTINEVHVVGTPQRSAKQIVRDIESILYVRGGVRLDYRKISLVQVAEGAIQGGSSRPQLIDVVAHNRDDGPMVVVTLSLRDEQAQGVGAQPPGQPADLPRLAAQATVNALENWVRPSYRVQLEQLQRQPFGALEVYLAQLALESEGGVETLLGISMLRGDELLAVAKAVLDAGNRRIERLLAEAPHRTAHASR